MTPLGLSRLYIRLRTRAFTIMCRQSFAAIGKKSALVPPLRVQGEDRIEIGADVYIGANSWIQAFAEHASHAESILTIGDNVCMSGSDTITAAERVVIEPRVLIAKFVHISDHSHAYEDSSRAIKDQGITFPKPVRIETGAWLGQGVVVCPGVTIGRNAVIGANSVVTRDIPAYCIAVGAPARVVKASPQSI